MYIYIGPRIRIGREIQCLPYAGFFPRLSLVPPFLPFKPANSQHILWKSLITNIQITSV